MRTALARSPGGNVCAAAALGKDTATRTAQRAAVRLRFIQVGPVDAGTRPIAGGEAACEAASPVDGALTAPLKARGRRHLPAAAAYAPAVDEAPVRMYSTRSAGDTRAEGAHMPVPARRPKLAGAVAGVGLDHQAVDPPDIRDAGRSRERGADPQCQYHRRHGQKRSATHICRPSLVSLDIPGVKLLARPDGAHPMGCALPPVVTAATVFGVCSLARNDL
jgi:hypothetical protein